MSFDSSSDPTVMATPPVQPGEPAGFNPNPENLPPVPKKKSKVWLIILIVALVLCCCCLVAAGGVYLLVSKGLLDTQFKFDIDDFSFFLPLLASLA